MTDPAGCQVSLCDDAQPEPRLDLVGAIGTVQRLGRSRSWTPQEWEQSLSWFGRNVQARGLGSCSRLDAFVRCRSAAGVCFRDAWFGA